MTTTGPSGYGAAEATGVTSADPETAALAIRFIERHCGPGAPAVLAALGLDEARVPLPPRRGPRPGPAPGTFRRPAKGDGTGDGAPAR